MNEEIVEESWWLMYCDFPNLNWARLRVLPSGKASVFDCDGRTLLFETKQEAVYWLAEDEYTRFAEIDSEDEIYYGINLAKIVLPESISEESLKEKMFVAAGA